jgi:hypothetical protein
MSTLSVSEIGIRDAASRPDFAVSWRPVLYEARHRFRTASDLATQTGPAPSPNMLAAIMDRENPQGAIAVPFQIGMARGPGCGVGDFQITSGVDWSDPNQPRYPGWGDLMDRQCATDIAAVAFLQPLLVQFPGSHLAVFAAYNLGGGGVAQELAQGLTPDAWTTDHDYALDVFTDWINFAAVSQGVSVDWPAWAGEVA